MWFEWYAESNEIYKSKWLISYQFISVELYHFSWKRGKFTGKIERFLSFFDVKKSLEFKKKNKIYKIFFELLKKNMKKIFKNSNFFLENREKIQISFKIKIWKKFGKFRQD